MTDPISITTLDNGLTVVTERMERVETVSFGAYVEAGTRDESEAENGVSHFLEHMAFKGTTRRSASQIAEEIENVGGHINAYTAREQTAYYVKLLKNDLPLGIDIIGDILTHSTFLPEEVERERGVILQEIGQARDTPDDIIFDYFQETAFPNQAMGRPTLGTDERVSSMTRETLVSYMERHYSTQNTVIAAAGNLEHAHVVDLVATHFADLPTKGNVRNRSCAYHGGEHRTSRELDQAHLVLGFPSVKITDPLYYDVMLLSTILGGGMSSRLFQEIRERRGLVYAIYAFVLPFSDAGLFGIYAGTGEQQTQELIPAVLDELQRAKSGFSIDEIARAKAQFKSSLFMSMESTSSRCEQIARQFQIHRRVLSPQEIIDRIEAVGAASLISACEQVFTAKPTFAALGPISFTPSLDAICRQLTAL